MSVYFKLTAQLLILHIILIPCVRLQNSIDFTSPTPDDGARVTSPLTFSSTVSCESDCSVFFNYDDSVMLWMNFENGIVDESVNKHPVQTGGLPVIISPNSSSYIRGKSVIFTEGRELDYLVVRDFPSPGPNYIVSMWVNLTKKPENTETSQYEYQNIYSRMNFGGVLLRVTTSGHLVAYPRNDTNGFYTQVNTGFNLQWNQLYHVVFGVREITQFSSEVLFYIDGELVHNEVLDYHIGGVEEPYDLYIGKWATQYFGILGIVDEVILIRRVLSDHEIRCLYNAKTDVSVTMNNIDITKDHQYSFIGISDLGDVFTTEVRVLSDGVTPVIVDNDVYVWVKDDQVNFNWTTSQECTSELRYGFDGNNYVVLSEKYKLSHTVLLRKLRRGRSYTFEICGEDKSRTAISPCFSGSFFIDEVESEFYMIPKPQIIEPRDYRTLVTTNWKILCTQENEFNAYYLRDRISKFVNLTVESELKSFENTNHRIILANYDDFYMSNILHRKKLRFPKYLLMNNESYLLEITKDCIILTSHSPKGVFYGVQTILQLLKFDSTIASGKIIDWSDHQIRGLFDHPSQLDWGYNRVINVEYIEYLVEMKYNLISIASNYFFYDPEKLQYIKPMNEFKEFLAERYVEILPSIGSLRGQLGKFEYNEGRWIRNLQLQFDSSNIARPLIASEIPIPNSNFETDVSIDWRVSTSSTDPTWSATISYDTTNPYEGTQSLVIENGYIDIYIESGFVPGDYYFMSWVSKGQSPCFGGLYFYNSQGVGHGKVTAMLDTPATEWKSCGTIVKVPMDAIRMRVLLYGRFGPNYVDSVQVSSATSSLRNVIRTETTDFVVTSVDKSTTYEVDDDYFVIDGDTNRRYSNDLVPFQIVRTSGSSIPQLGDVLVTFDALMNWDMSDKSYSNTPPCLSEQRIYDEYFYPAINRSFTNVNDLKYVHFNSDEIRGFQTDSRNLQRNLTNAELLSEFINKLMNFGKSIDSEIKFFMWDDMPSIYHNGYNEYQNHYGGKPGAMSDMITQNMIDDPHRLVMDIWWYSDEWLTQMFETPRWFRDAGFSYVFSTSTYDSMNSVSWSEIMADDPNSLGGIITYWGKGDYQKVFPVHADHLWNTRFTVVVFDSFENGVDEFLQNWKFKNSAINSAEESENITKKIEKFLDCESGNFIGRTLGGYNKCSLRIDNSSAVVSDFIAVSKAKMYVFSVHIKRGVDVISPGFPPKISMNWYTNQNDHSAAVIHSTSVVVNESRFEIGESDEFYLFEISEMAPTNARFLTVEMSVLKDIYYFDVIRVKREFNDPPKYEENVDTGMLLVLILGVPFLVIVICVTVVTVFVVGFFIGSRNSENEVEKDDQVGEEEEVKLMDEPKEDLRKDEEDGPEDSLDATSKK